MQKVRQATELLKQMLLTWCLKFCANKTGKV